MTTRDNRHGTLEEFIAVARHYRWVIIVATLAVPIVAFALSSTQSKVYRATSEVLLDQQDLGSALTGIPNTSSGTDPERFARTQAALASVAAVAERALALAEVDGMTARQLLRSSDVSPRSDADLLKFTVDNASATTAARLATAYATAFTSYQLERDTANLGRARKELESRLADLRRQGASDSQLYADLFEKANSLRTLELLQARASVVRPATTGVQVEPRPVRNAALGVVLGLLLGFGTAFLLNTLDKRVRHEDEVESGLGIPLLARLPRYGRRTSDRPELVMLKEPTHIAAESVRRLRTNLELAAMTVQAKTVMVTSAAPREGKSTTISNLAVALARSGHDVVLVDLDLRKPIVSKIFNLDGRLGVTDAVLRRSRLDDALTPIHLTAPRARGLASAPLGTLRVLPAGPLPSDPGEFVTSPGLAELLQELRDRSDFVLIDAPPMLAVGDAVSISTIADALFVVVRTDITDRPMLRDLARTLEGCPAARLGFVLTDVDLSEIYGSGRYGYAQDKSSGADLPADIPPLPPAVPTRVPRDRQSQAEYRR